MYFTALFVSKTLTVAKHMEIHSENDLIIEKCKSKKVKSAIIWTVVLLLSVALTAVIASYFTWSAAKKRYREEDGHLVFTIREAREIIRDHYFYYEEDERALTEAALKGIAREIGDRYAEYYTAEEYEELKKQNERTFVGIGILTQINDDGRVEIVDVYSDTPASEAGLQAGDLILQINDAVYNGDALGDFLANLHAEDGAENTFVIMRGEKTLSFTLIAREVHTPSVSSRMLTDSIGYIHILTFHGTCVEETQQAIDDLKSKGMKSLVLDLRDNLGGSLYDAVDIADFFLPKNYVVTTLRSRTGQMQEYKTERNGLEIQIVLLVNEYSASASELVAGALKDYDAAYLIGTRTYGKGIVQTYYQITETNGWLKLTSEAYFTPNGVCVQDEGIEPDQIIELPEGAENYAIDQLPFDMDTQLQAAIKYLER